MMMVSSLILRIDLDGRKLPKAGIEAIDGQAAGREVDNALAADTVFFATTASKFGAQGIGGSEKSARSP